MFIKDIEKKLDKARDILDATSCTFYALDPHWPDQFRLVAMSGVKIQEPMYGFVLPESAKKIVSEGNLRIFCPDVSRSPAFRGVQMELSNIPKKNRFLFGHFYIREKVRSSARLIHDKKQAVLFVNFSSQIKFTNSIKKQIISLFTNLVNELPTIRNELVALDVAWLSEATKIVSPAWSIANPSFQSLDELDQYFNEIIEVSLEAMQIEKGKGLGTLHLYNSEKQLLELHGKYGDIEEKKALQHSVTKGEGVVSWVILRGRSVLIQDLERSEFRRIHRWINKNVKSELAVPLDFAGKTIGVICLECTEVNKFLPHHVRSLWYAANKAAIAYELNQQASMNRKLVHLFWKATGGEEDAKKALKDIVTLAADYLKASHCDIWRWNPDTGNFDISAASYVNFIPQQRKNGWTEFIRRTQNTIWASSITSTRDYDIHHWSDAEWRKGAGGKKPPRLFNAAPVRQKIQGEIGIPIIVGGECTGVLWVKYKYPQTAVPAQHVMTLAHGMASEAGLVLESIQRRTVEQREREEIDIVAQQIADGISQRWELADSSIIDSYILSKPHKSKLGGDFYAGKRINDSTVGIILIDGEGHGIRGCLQMLPLMAAFESSYSSCSTAHVATELFQLARIIGVKGTLAYCIFTVIDEQTWICASRAGHEKFIVFERDAEKWTFRFFPKIAGPLLGHPMRLPITEERREVSPGTIIIGFTDGVAEHTEINNLTYFVLKFLTENREVSNLPKLLAEAILKWSEQEPSKGLKDDATVFAICIK